MIFYFSGTGNSAWVARCLAAYLREDVCSVAEHRGKELAHTCREGEKIGFVFPVYAWGPPPVVLDFIRSLRMSAPAYLFFVCTCGDDTGQTAQVFSRAVRRKGWTCDAGYSVTMPNTYVSLPGFDVDEAEVAARKVRNACGRLQFIGAGLAQGVQMKGRFDCHEGSFPYLKTYVLRPLFRRFLMSPQPFVATAACTACKRCERVCPLRNVTVTDRPRWGTDCAQCLACYHSCPQHAVQYGRFTQGKGQYLFREPR